MLTKVGNCGFLCTLVECLDSKSKMYKHILLSEITRMQPNMLLVYIRYSNCVSVLLKM